MLKETYIQLLSNYTDNLKEIELHWEDIYHHHSHKDRHYHALNHLKNLLIQLKGVKNEISNWEACLFVLYYHDIIYNVKKKNNEELSAEYAEKVMQQLAVPSEIVQKTKTMINATKSHLTNENPDINYFIDADLSVLGFPWKDYQVYFQQVRKEYKMYPNVLYKPGHKKVLQHFLSMDRVYKTNYFYNKFEEQARANMASELDLL